MNTKKNPKRNDTKEFKRFYKAPPKTENKDKDSELMSIQWFPGHMAKTRRMMKENLPLVDLVIEVIDARIPYSSRNPEILSLLSGKPHIVLLNKTDLADQSVTDSWRDRLKGMKQTVISANCRTGKGLNALEPLIRSELTGLYEKLAARGMENRPTRVMVVGIPNCGKSSLINRLSNEKKTAVADRPGVTRGKQWVTTESGMEVLDMPGVLWPKFDDPVVGENLAFTGAIKSDILDIESLAVRLIGRLRKDYSSLLENRYSITITDDAEDYMVLEEIAKSRGMLLRGGEYNTERAAIMLLDEFRDGVIGHISLERPQ